MKKIVTARADSVGKSRTVPAHVQRGQGMTEYIVIVALIAVAAIGVYQLFGQVVRSQTAAIAQEIGGVDGTTTNAKAVAAANLTTAQTAKKGLDAYTGAKAATGAP